MLRAAMLFALSTTNKFGLAGTGAAFILFALISSFILPRMNANFPGKGLRVYLVICVAFFAAMISAVLLFGKEKKVAEAAATPPAATTPAGAPTGNPTAGKAVFLGASGCAACHTFKPAAATGKIGPDLDSLAADATAAKESLDAFVRESVVSPDAYIAPGFTKGIMPTNFGTTLKPTQIDDLVAFLTQGK
jgi:mono/diheme cytochrome c family protein